MKQTKIVCTISDQHCEQDFLRHLFFAGMNVVRRNVPKRKREYRRILAEEPKKMSTFVPSFTKTDKRL